MKLYMEARLGSETSKCRESLARFCSGNGLDLGYGGDPILPHAITVDSAKPYKTVGDSPLNLAGDARYLKWFNDETLDFVFSSHLLEDFEPYETMHVILEWLRVLKIGGRLVLYLPDEPTYRAHCDRTGQEYNKSHKVADFGLDYLKRIISPINNVKVIHEPPVVNDYSFEIVLEKTSANPDTGPSLRARAKRFRDAVLAPLRPVLRPVKRALMALLGR